MREKLPNLVAAILANQPEIVIGGMGSSVGNGPTLPDPDTQSPSPKFASLLDSALTRIGLGLNTTFTADNESVDGSVVFSYATALAEITDPNTKAIVICYGMNDGQAAHYNFGQTFTLAESRTEAMVDAILALGIDPILVTSPHPHPDRVTVAAASDTSPMNYPSLTWRKTESFTFASATKRITATTAGAFNEGTGITGLASGQGLYVSSGTNQGLYTIDAIDGSGDFLTVDEALADTMYSVEIHRADIQPEELIPPASESFVTQTWNGSVSAEGSVRHGAINQMFRDVADDKGILCIDAEPYWMGAVADVGYDALYDANESVHPNLEGHTESYWAAFDAALLELGTDLFGSYGDPRELRSRNVSFSSKSLTFRGRTPTLQGKDRKGGRP